jgi:hypothetical protein
MKTVAWVFVALAAIFLIFVLYFGLNFLLNSTIKTEAKVLGCFLALLALGTTLGRFVFVIKDLKKKSTHENLKS